MPLRFSASCWPERGRRSRRPLRRISQWPPRPPSAPPASAWLSPGESFQRMPRKLGEPLTALHKLGQGLLGVPDHLLVRRRLGIDSSADRCRQRSDGNYLKILHQPSMVIVISTGGVPDMPVLRTYSVGTGAVSSLAAKTCVPFVDLLKTISCVID